METNEKEANMCISEISFRFFANVMEVVFLVKQLLKLFQTVGASVNLTKMVISKFT